MSIEKKNGLEEVAKKEAPKPSQDPSMKSSKFVFDLQKLETKFNTLKDISAVGAKISKALDKYKNSEEYLESDENYKKSCSALVIISQLKPLFKNLKKIIENKNFQDVEEKIVALKNIPGWEGLAEKMKNIFQAEVVKNDKIEGKPEIPGIEVVVEKTEKEIEPNAEKRDFYKELGLTIDEIKKPEDLKKIIDIANDKEFFYNTLSEDVPLEEKETYRQAVLGALGMIHDYLMRFVKASGLSKRDDALENKIEETINDLFRNRKLKNKIIGLFREIFSDKKHKKEELEIKVEKNTPEEVEILTKEIPEAKNFEDLMTVIDKVNFVESNGFSRTKKVLLKDLTSLKSKMDSKGVVWLKGMTTEDYERFPKLYGFRDKVEEIINGFIEKSETVEPSVKEEILPVGQPVDKKTEEIVEAVEEEKDPLKKFEAEVASLQTPKDISSLIDKVDNKPLWEGLFETDIFSAQQKKKKVLEKNLSLIASYLSGEKTSKEEAEKAIAELPEALGLRAKIQELFAKGIFVEEAAKAPEQINEKEISVEEFETMVAGLTQADLYAFYSVMYKIMETDSAVSKMLLEKHNKDSISHSLDFIEQSMRFSDETIKSGFIDKEHLKERVESDMKYIPEVFGLRAKIKEIVNREWATKKNGQEGAPTESSSTESPEKEKSFEEALAEVKTIPELLALYDKSYDIGFSKAWIEDLNEDIKVGRRYWIYSVYNKLKEHKEEGEVHPSYFDVQNKIVEILAEYLKEDFENKDNPLGSEEEAGNALKDDLDKAKSLSEIRDAMYKNYWFRSGDHSVTEAYYFLYENAMEDSGLEVALAEKDFVAVKKIKEDDFSRFSGFYDYGPSFVAAVGRVIDEFLATEEVSASAKNPEEEQEKNDGTAVTPEAKKEIVNYKENKFGDKYNDSLRRTIGMTAWNTFASISGFKLYTDIPQYIEQRLKVRGNFLGIKGKGLEGSVEDILAASQAASRIHIENKELEKKDGIKRVNFLKERGIVNDLFKDLNERLAMTKEGGVRGSEQRNALAKLLYENRHHDETTKEKRSEEIKHLLDNYFTTKTTGMEVAKQAMNTALMSIGAYAFRGIGYGLFAFIEAKQKMEKEELIKAERIKTEKEKEEKINAEKENRGEQAIKLEVRAVKSKEVFLTGLKNTYTALLRDKKEGWMVDKEKREKGFFGFLKSLSTKKNIERVKAFGTVLRFAGITTMGVTSALSEHGAAQQSYGNIFHALQGKLSWNDFQENMSKYPKMLGGAFGFLTGAHDGAPTLGASHHHLNVAPRENINNAPGKGLNTSSADSLHDTTAQQASQPASADSLKTTATVPDTLGATHEQTLAVAAKPEASHLNFANHGGKTVWAESKNQLEHIFGKKFEGLTPAEKVLAIDRVKDYVVAHAKELGLNEKYQGHEGEFNKITPEELNKIDWSKDKSLGDIFNKDGSVKEIASHLRVPNAEAHHVATNIVAEEKTGSTTNSVDSASHEIHASPKPVFTQDVERVSPGHFNSVKTFSDVESAKNLIIAANAGKFKDINLGKVPVFSKQVLIELAKYNGAGIISAVGLKADNLDYEKIGLLSKIKNLVTNDKVFHLIADYKGHQVSGANNLSDHLEKITKIAQQPAPVSLHEAHNAVVPPVSEVSASNIEASNIVHNIISHDSQAKLPKINLDHLPEKYTQSQMIEIRKYFNDLIAERNSMIDQLKDYQVKYGNKPNWEKFSQAVKEYISNGGNKIEMLVKFSGDPTKEISLAVQNDNFGGNGPEEAAKDLMTLLASDKHYPLLNITEQAGNADAELQQHISAAPAKVADTNIFHQGENLKGHSASSNGVIQRPDALKTGTAIKIEQPPLVEHSLDTKELAQEIGHLKNQHGGFDGDRLWDLKAYNEALKASGVDEEIFRPRFELVSSQINDQLIELDDPNLSPANAKIAISNIAKLITNAEGVWAVKSATNGARDTFHVFNDTIRKIAGLE